MLLCPMLKIGRRKTLYLKTHTWTSVVVGVFGVALVACCEPSLSIVSGYRN